jgi:hypothetical protein
MKKIYILIYSLFISSALLAQEVKNVGIGTTAPDQSAVLDIQSVNKGLLIPRLTEAQMNTIVNPAKGLLVFKTEVANSGFFFYNGEKWSPLTNGGANAIATGDVNGWSLTGNATAVAGVKAAATSESFIGTPAGIPLNFKIGGVTAGVLYSNTNLFLGYQSGLSGVGGGSYNVGIGAQTLASLTTGNTNTAVGSGALQSNTTGNLNMAIGGLSLNNNTIGVSNVALGHAAMNKNISGGNNVALGKDALFNTNGSFNIGIGSGALTALTTGNRNTVVGVYAGGVNSYGSSNTFIGYMAGYNETGSNKLYIANTNTTTPLLYGDFSARFLSIGDVPVAKRDAVANSGQYSLIVEKGILSEKLKVALKTSDDWADYVFEPEYKAKMMSLEEVEKFTLENKHLPNVPSAAELVEKGLDFNETSRMFMEKIEELTLYIIELNKEVKALKLENKDLKEKLRK